MESKVPEVLMERMKKLMAERFISKKDMAERLGMEYITFWRKLNGKRPVDVNLLKRIAEILGTSVGYLLGETDNPLHISSTIGSQNLMKRQERVSEATLNLEAMLKDLVYEYPDLAIGFRDTREKWGELPENTKRSIADGLAMLFTPSGKYVNAHFKTVGKHGEV